uniref:60S ribosomal protein L34 n=1 Tax=Trichuris muris TaxID=70415 RepID=A0A5S6R450_TRIMR
MNTGCEQPVMIKIEKYYGRQSSRCCTRTKGALQKVRRKGQGIRAFTSLKVTLPKAHFSEHTSLISKFSLPIVQFME